MNIKTCSITFFLKKDIVGYRVRNRCKNDQELARLPLRTTKKTKSGRENLLETLHYIFRSDLAFLIEIIKTI